MLCKISSRRRRTAAEPQEIRALQENQLQALMEKEAKIEKLERQLTRNKSKLEVTEQSESLVKQMLEAWALIQQDDGTFFIKQQ